LEDGKEGGGGGGGGGQEPPHLPPSNPGSASGFNTCDILFYYSITALQWPYVGVAGLGVPK